MVAGGGFIPIIYIKGKNKINKGNWMKKISFMHTKRSFFNGFNFCSLGIALDSWSPEAGFIPIIYIKGKNKINKGN